MNTRDDLIAAGTFVASFKKANGQVRTGTFRAEADVNDKPNILTVVDTEIGEYRKIPIDRLTSFQPIV